VWALPKMQALLDASSTRRRGAPKSRRERG
jgi:hypothetical protein